MFCPNYFELKLEIFLSFADQKMAHLSPPPSPPMNNVPKLPLPFSNIMDGLDRLQAAMSPQSIIQRANLNSALRHKLNRGLFLLLS